MEKFPSRKVSRTMSKTDQDKFDYHVETGVQLAGEMDVLLRKLQSWANEYTAMGWDTGKTDTDVQRKAPHMNYDDYKNLVARLTSSTGANSNVLAPIAAYEDTWSQSKAPPTR